jgi:hypothetical protein
MFNIDDIITGERLQETAGVYLGLVEDFYYNPRIGQQYEKHLSFDYLTSQFNNPNIIFCYSHRIDLLLKKINFFKNRFILITHNSDGNIMNNDETVSKLLENPLVYKWYGQNVCMNHEKLKFLPIGMANSQWKHSDTSYFLNESKIKNLHKNKTHKVYFNFNLSTNPNKRNLCYKKLKDRLTFLNTVSPTEYHDTLSKHEFCICPEGNGVDTHRLWEALYLKSVPIVLKTPFIEIILSQTNIKMVVLERWEDLDINTLDYSKYNFDTEEYYKYLKLQNYRKEIIKSQIDI